MPPARPFFIGDFLETSREYTVGADDVFLFPFELIVPVALTPITDDDDPGDLDYFPAKIDPGFSGNFHISRTHLESASWANTSVRRFRPTGEQTAYTYANTATEKFALYDGDLWIPRRANEPPFHLRLDGGFTICGKMTKGRPVPRVPLLGQRALAEARLKLEVDYSAHTFSLWTA